MISGTLTLFNWSLRSDARSIYPHIVRAGFAGFMMLSIASAYASSLTGVGPGLKFFQAICFLNTLLISVSGISYFVSAVTEEKDAGTLSLLRLAGVTPLSIILSKSTSRLISAMMLLAIQLPFTFLAITLGGVTWQQIIAAYLALAAWMWLVANLALFCSVRCSTSGRAAVLAATLLLAVISGSAILNSAATALKTMQGPLAPVISVCEKTADALQNLSVFNQLEKLLAVARPLELMTDQIVWSSAAGMGLLLLSVLMFNRYAHPVVDMGHGKSPGVRRITVGRCWGRAIVWKDFLFFTGGKTFFVVKFLAYGMVVAGFYQFHRMERPHSALLMSNELAWTCFLVLVGVLVLEVLLYSSGSLFLEARQSTIASLTMLPISTGVILAQKAIACVLALVPVVFWIATVALLFPEVTTQRISGTMIVTVVFEVLLCSHLTVLLSLYTRWAALPLAILLTAASFMCCPFVTLAVFELSDSFARINGISWGMFLGALANLVWAWLFVLLPMEIEIVKRWHRLSRE